jgi:tRNA-splicing ligase RtcB (3'-phosphate/5'-hydroxy nucleic acid ligase)
MSELKKIGSGMYELVKTGKMRVAGLIIATEKLMQEINFSKPLEQVKNVAHLPGIVNYSIAMPDIHWGYGFPIGGVAAMNLEDGVISPGGVGYDINCGVRLALVPLTLKDLDQRTLTQLLYKIFDLVPSGIGKGQKNEKNLSNKDYHNIALKGAKWSIEQGFGLQEDLNHIENHGLIEGADLKFVSDMAKRRGEKQLGTIGSGNHFLEIGEVEQIFDKQIAEKWKIEKGQLYLFIHTGSRGFGHQICQDYLNEYINKNLIEDLPDKQLVSALINSDEGKAYFKAMATAANFAFNNRQIILHQIRKAFQEIFKIQPGSIKLVYDVCHNIAKFEEHLINGIPTKLCVHRKGATRAFGPNSKELTEDFQTTGQPVLVPGDMLRASYVLAGLGNEVTFKSCCHGAGRAKSRHLSTKNWKGQNVIKHMQDMGVRVLASSKRTVIEEMYDAYKDVSDVVEAVEKAKLAKKVAKLKPSYVIKG